MAQFLNFHRHVSVPVAWHGLYYGGKYSNEMNGQLAFVCSGEQCPFVASSDGKCMAGEKAGVVLPRCFGHHSFRSGQLDAILPALHGKDVFVRMATGSGKSLCMYLVPLTMSDSSIGVVISPLVGPIGQQV